MAALQTTLRGQHTPTCAVGARAEARRACDCGAGELPYRARTVPDTDGTGKRLVEIQIDDLLTTGEVGQLSIMLQELTRDEGQRWARAQERKKR
jgi:hypothetical protein